MSDKTYEVYLRRIKSECSLNILEPWLIRGNLLYQDFNLRTKKTCHLKNVFKEKRAF